VTTDEPAPADDELSLPRGEHDPVMFRAVIEQAQALTTLGLLGDGRPAPAPEVMRQAVDELHDVVGAVPTWSTPPPVGGVAITYAAVCRTCNTEGVDSTGFSSQLLRNSWAAGHARARGHTVTLVEQHPSTGSTITGKCEPESEHTARPPAPLVAFVVREGGPPDMLVRIPPRAAAAWLLTAAHAALLGKGSMGVDQPHRVLYVGRLTRDGEFWQVRIDGLLGATDQRFGGAVGMVCRIDGKLTPAQAEDVVEALVARANGLTRNLFSVVIMSDAPPNDPPDADADAVLRAERLTADPGDGCVPPLPG
jgi:hypothetical protein